MPPFDPAGARETLLAYYDEDPVAPGEIAAVEATLKVVLPDDLKAVAAFYSGGYLGGISHYAIAARGPADNVVDETQRLRTAIGLPTPYIVLAEPPASLIVLETGGNSADPTPVTWLSATDAARLASGEPFLSAPDVYPSYGAFFFALLEREAEEHV